MRMLVITDTHGVFKPIYEKHKDKLTDIQMILLLGDHSQTDVLQIKDYFAKETLLIYGIYGNHDIATTLAGTPCFDHKVCHFGFSFTGFNGSHRYKDSQIYGYTQKEGLWRAETLPKVDVLFSHDGPYNKSLDDAHCGLKGITRYIKKKHPKTVIHGHLHKPNHYVIKHFGKQTDVYCVYQLAIIDFNADGTVKELNQLETI